MIMIMSLFQTTMYDAMKAKVRMSITGTQNGTGTGPVGGGVGPSGLTAEDRARVCTHLYNSHICFFRQMNTRR